MTPHAFRLPGFMPQSLPPSTTSYRMSQEETLARSTSTAAIVNSLMDQADLTVTEHNNHYACAHITGLALNYLERMQERSWEPDEEIEAEQAQEGSNAQERTLEQIWQLQKEVYRRAKPNAQRLHDQGPPETPGIIEARTAATISFNCLGIAFAEALQIHLSRIDSLTAHQNAQADDPEAQGHAQAAMSLHIALKGVRRNLISLNSRRNAPQRPRSRSRGIPDQDKPSTQAIRQFNERINTIASLIPVNTTMAEGLMEDPIPVLLQMARNGTNIALHPTAEPPTTDDTLILFFQNSTLTAQPISAPFSPDTTNDEAVAILEEVYDDIVENHPHLHGLLDSMDQIDDLARAGLHAASRQDVDDFLKAIQETTADPGVLHYAAVSISGTEEAFEAIQERHQERFQVAGPEQQKAIMKAAADAGLTTGQLKTLDNLLQGKNLETNTDPARLNNQETIGILEKAKKINPGTTRLQAVAYILQGASSNNPAVNRWIIANGDPDLDLDDDDYDVEYEEDDELY